MPRAPKGFQVSEFATGLHNPRKIVTAPNGDIFVAESYAQPHQGAARRRRRRQGRDERGLRDRTGQCRSGSPSIPPGPNPTHVYIGNTNSVVRFAYQSGDTKAREPAEVIVNNIPSGREQVGGGGHWTRDLEFSKDGKTLFVSVGSRSNVSDDQRENRRADILAFDPDGKNERDLRLGHPQRRRPGHPPRNRPALGLGQRARRTGRPPCPRLRHPRRGRRLLRLALVSTSAPIRIRATRASTPSSKTR